MSLYADADEGSQYEDGTEGSAGEEEHSHHSGHDGEASADEVLDELVDDADGEESSFVDSVEERGGSDDDDDESIE